MPSPDEAVYWIDQAGTQMGPEPFSTLQQRVEYGQVPPSTAVWWNGAPEWMRFAEIPKDPPPPPAPPPAPASVPTDSFAPAPAPDEGPLDITPPAGDPVEGAPPAAETSLDPQSGPAADRSSTADEAEPAPEPVSAWEPAVEAAAGAVVEPEPESAAPVSRQLLQGYADQELDDEFIALVARSWELYKETEHATSIDEVFLGGVITAMVDSGFLLIDVETAGASLVPTTAVEVTTSTVGAGEHRLRFEEPANRSRVTVAIQHLTPDAATAKLIGHRAAAVIGYGERVPNFSQVGQAVRQELASAFIASPEPGTVSFDADMTSGYVYAQIDLLLELDRYVDEGQSIDHDLLRKHLAAVVFTMQSFVRARFAA